MKRHVKGGQRLLAEHKRPAATPRRVWANMPLRCLEDARDWLWKPMRLHYPDMPPKALAELLVHGIMKCEEDDRGDRTTRLQ